MVNTAQTSGSKFEEARAELMRDIGDRQVEWIQSCAVSNVAQIKRDGDSTIRSDQYVLKENRMKSKKLFAGVLGPLVVLAVSLPMMAQSTTQDSSLAPQTTTTTTTTQGSSAPVTTAKGSNAPDTNAPMTKGEMKDQREQQKQEEKSANANAKAQKYEAKEAKDEAKALKQKNKSTDASEKANSPQ
jgi:hypothetical protein